MKTRPRRFSPRVANDAVKDFLNPKSMLTPGIAGGIIMVLANTLWVQFALHPKWTGLALSFALGLVVFSAAEMASWQRMVYWLLNSLIIFSMGIGANSLGATAIAGARTGASFSPSSAYAQDRQPEQLRKERINDTERLKRIEEKLDRIEATKPSIQGSAPSPSPAREKRSFFGGDWMSGSGATESPRKPRRERPVD